MRPKRELAADCWYYVNTAVNNGEPLFRSKFGVWLFGWVLSEARLIFAFELCVVRFNGVQVSFFIRPADGFELPAIMQCIKQTFAVRFNRDHGRTGLSGAPKAARETLSVLLYSGFTNDPPNGADRYKSEILPGEPPEWAKVYRFLPIVRSVKRTDWRRRRGVSDGKRMPPAGRGGQTPVTA